MTPEFMKLRDDVTTSTVDAVDQLASFPPSGNHVEYWRASFAFWAFEAGRAALAGASEEAIDRLEEAAKQARASYRRWLASEKE